MGQQEILRIVNSLPSGVFVSANLLRQLLGESFEYSCTRTGLYKSLASLVKYDFIACQRKPRWHKQYYGRKCSASVKYYCDSKLELVLAEVNGD